MTIYQERRSLLLKGYAMAGVILFIAFPQYLTAQVPFMNAGSGPLLVPPNDTLSVMLSVDSAAVDAYYLELEAVFDPAVFSFVNESPAGLFSGGISVADSLAMGRIGASVSLTSALAAPDSGNLLLLRFRVHQKAPVGISGIRFENVGLYDSSGEPIAATAPDTVFPEIDEAVSDLQLTIPADTSIVEGNELAVDGKVYVNDITVNETVESSRIDVWVGLNDSGTTPSSWSETAWAPMAFSTAQQGYHFYSGNTGFGLEPGDYTIALRARLDAGNYVFSGNTTALAITGQPPFRYTLAAWNFDDQTLIASQSVPDNEGMPLSIAGAQFEGFSSGASGSAADADNWDAEGGVEKYWIASVSTLGFNEVSVSSKQSGTSSGPRDFELEVSLDSLSWEVVSPDTIRVADNWSSGILNDQSLPGTYDNQGKIFLRWIRRGDIRVDGTTGITVGKNRIDDIVINGQNLNPVDAFVWPGDCDQDGLVDELDVFRIGQYWLAEGPLPVFPGITWDSRKVEEWIPAEATYADANGDGVVNHKDLLPLGLHFGKNTSTSETTHLADNRRAAGSLNLDALQAGEEIEVQVKTKKPAELTGFSLKMNIEEVDPEAWIIKELETGEWGKPWASDNKFLIFKRRDKKSPEISHAVVHKGSAELKKTDHLATLRIGAVQEWKTAGKIVVERAVIAQNRKEHTLESVLLVNPDAGGSGNPPSGGVPEEFRLYQNYPNPFNPATVIRYDLPSDRRVSLVIYDMLGRRVATLIDEVQEAGKYRFPYHAGHLSSGVYIYRLKSGEYIRSKKFMLMK